MEFKDRQKIFAEKNWSYMEKLYHIYAGGKCLLPNIKEDEFSVTWNTVKAMVGLMQTDYNENDLSYEEVVLNRQLMQEESSY